MNEPITFGLTTATLCGVEMDKHECRLDPHNVRISVHQCMCGIRFTHDEVLGMTIQQWQLENPDLPVPAARWPDGS